MQAPLISTIFRLLSEDETIRNIVNGRIFTFNADGYRDSENLSDALPEITHTLLTTSIKNRDIGLFESIYQVSCWAETLADANTLSEAVAQKLDKYQNADGIEKINLETLTNVRDPDSYAYGIHLRFIIVFRKKSLHSTKKAI